MTTSDPHKRAVTIDQLEQWLALIEEAVNDLPITTKANHSPFVKVPRDMLRYRRAILELKRLISHPPQDVVV